jgi:hypothetical protein
VSGYCIASDTVNTTFNLYYVGNVGLPRFSDLAPLIYKCITSKLEKAKSGRQ